MIRGVVNAKREAVVCLRVRGPGGTASDVDVIVDSGFTSSLTLPAGIVATLGLPMQSRSSALLADGSRRTFDICTAEVEWDGIWRTISVSAIGNQPLMGMRMLAGHKLVIDVVQGGLVEIVPLP